MLLLGNIENADYTKQPIFSSGTYVNNQLAGQEHYEDYIVAWFADSEGNFSEILLNEETTLTTTHPIFIIDNAEVEITHRPKSRVKVEQPKQLENMATSWYSSNEYQINHRYENSTHSEFCITSAQIDEKGLTYLIFRDFNGNDTEWRTLADVHKNDINKLLYRWFSFCRNDVLPFNQNFIFWNTYERDWAKSPKNLGYATKNGATIYLYGRRQYTSEWYAYNPAQLANNPVDLNTIYNSWAKWHDNSNGRLKIWRIQP